MSNFSTLETLMLYKVNYGGQSADILTSLSYHPDVVPYVHSIDTENLVFKWNFLRENRLSEAEYGLPPKWLKLHLFRPRDPEQKPPPPPVSDSPSGFTLRGVNKQMEDSELWANYINPYYLPIEGIEVVAHSREELNDDRANILWPGKRRSHMSYYIGDRFSAPDPITGGPGEFITVEQIPLRVSAVLDENPRMFLILTEIKRTRRLRLNVYQYEVRYVSSDTRTLIRDRIASGSLSIEEAERDYGLQIEPFSDPEKEAPPPYPGREGIGDAKREHGKKD